MVRTKSPHPGQLDLFLATGETAFFNDFTAALKQHEAARASKCLRRLATALPNHPKLPAYQTLCAALRDWPFPAVEPADIAAAVVRLDNAVVPAAQTILSQAAAEFMATFWRRLAEAATTHAYDPALPQAYRAGLWLRCGEDQAALEAVEAADGWEDRPDLLAWLCQARHGLGGLEECWPVLLRLALVAPARLADMVETLGDARLDRVWKSFNADCGGLEGDDPAAWFPAWHGLANPGLRAISGAMPVSLEAKVCALVQRLNILEGQGAGPEWMAARQRLRELAPTLFEIYLKRRGEPA